MKKALLFLLLFLSVALRAQTPDEIERKLQARTLSDSARVELLVDFCVANTFANQPKNLTYAQKALQISRKIKYPLGEIRALNCVGNYYYQQAIYDKAVTYYTQALRLATRLKMTDNIVIGNSNLASVYTRDKKFEKALVLLQEADKILLETGSKDNPKRAAILTNLGIAYGDVSQYQKAIECHEEVLRICASAKIPFGIILAKSNIGSCYYKQNQFEKAIPFLQAAIRIAKENEASNLLGQPLAELAVCYQKKKDYTRATALLNESIAVSEPINNQHSLLSAYQKLHELEFETGNYSKAYKTLLLYQSKKDSVYTIEKEQVISRLSEAFESEKKESKIKGLLQEKRITDLKNQTQERTIWILVLVFLLLTVLAFASFRRYQNRKKNELLRASYEEATRALVAEKRATESELTALKSQMNPHFIFNALNSIQHLFMYGDKVVANKQLENFTTLTREILSFSGKRSITLSAEIELLKRYLELEKMRFNDDFEYHIHVGSELDPDFDSLPPMILQPFVENALKHGLLHKKGSKKLEISFTETNNTLLCTIYDNGIGRKASRELTERSVQHESFATSAIDKQLELLNTDETTYSVTYEDLYKDGIAAGTRVVLKITHKE
ncbi:tetratricopeptide repeat-containing sensor histidine kinase [Flavobacterium sp.]|uniref:tetratricopeptide repeat-containing sensor histidine kinase n=1 Tax=Flavobacterium sp. TaxID=239 RepID=UPI003B9BCAFB